MNFALLMLILLLVTGAIWLWTILVFAGRRDQRREGTLVDRVSKEFLPIILIVFLAALFSGRTFKIPSGSMIPTLLVGDFILVNKFTYGIRLPVSEQKHRKQTCRGAAKSWCSAIPRIRRSITISSGWSACRAIASSYRNKRLTINGQLVQWTRTTTTKYTWMAD